MTDNRQQAESKTPQLGPCVHAVSPLYGGEIVAFVIAGHFFFFFFFLSSGGWRKIKHKLTTLPRIFIRVVCRFNSVAFATQR